MLQDDDYRREMSLKKLHIFVTIAVMMALILSGCGGEDTGTTKGEEVESTSSDSAEGSPEEAAEGPIVLGMYEPLSGPSAYYGQSAVNGARMAESEINEAGGILGRRLVLVTEDTEGDVTGTSSAVKKLITQDEVSGLIGAFYSSSTLAAMPLLERYEVPDITGVSTSPEITQKGNQWIFRSVATDAMNSAPYVEYMVDELGHSTFAFLASDGDFGRDAVAAYSPLIEESGGEVLDEMYFADTETDFRSRLTTVRQLEPDVLVLVSEGAAGALVAKQARQMDLPATIMGIGTQAEQEFIETAGEGAEGVYCATSYVASIDTPENEEFVAKYQGLYEDEPTEYSLAEYQDVYIFSQAIERAGSDDRTAIRDALKETDYTGISGRIAFDENNQAHPWVFITEIVDGNLTIAKKAEAAQVQ